MFGRQKGERSVPAHLLRRLREQGRDQNWVAVAVDFVIVAVGVFLGIEAANWNEARKERAEERRYYAQIVHDLRADQQGLTLAQRRSSQFDAAAEETLRVWDQGLPPWSAPGRFAVQVHYAGFLYIPRPAGRTHEELISTGNLGVLRSDEVKAAIAQYYAKFDDLRQWDELLREQQSRYWQTTAGVLPRKVLQAAIRFREPRLTAAEGEQILARLRARPEVRNLLIAMAAHQERVRRDSEQLSLQGRELITKLESLAR
jgi:hypothetical protein